MVKSSDKNNNRDKPDPHADREAKNYENPIASREHILQLIDQQGPLSRAEILKLLELKGHEQREALRRRLRAMERDNQLNFRKSDGRYLIYQAEEQLQGVVEAHRDGYGFLLLPGEEDIYLSEREMRKVMHGDTVIVQPLGQTRRGGIEGRIEKIVEHANKKIVGRLNKEKGQYFVVPDNPRLSHDILINEPLPKGAAAGKSALTVGDYVVTEIIQFPSGKTAATGKITEALGEPLAPGLEIELAIRQYGIPHEWPESVSAETSKLGAEPEENDKKHRVDLRQLPLVTIDGEDARDFDDAVYCEKRKGGGFTLWVAIADVAHYVPCDSALDKVAFERATSVYFPGRVVPMLPEEISNGLCSLNPNVDRLAMACELRISAKGKLTEYQFCEAVIRSHARLTYNEVAEVLGLSNRTPRAGLTDRLSSLMPQLRNLHELYECLNVKRKERGAIEFESTETQMVFNAERKIDSIVPVTRNDAHKIIEECMLCANVAAATLLEASDRSTLYRVHEGPKAQKLINLREYLGELGLSLSGGDKPVPADYQKLMQQIEGRSDAHLIQIMLLRSLSQAVYQPDNEGHFGLAFTAYAHFTSPIRRYPDLLVHRAIRSLIRSKAANDHVKKVTGAGVIARKRIYPYVMEDVIAQGIHCSMAERRADEATRDVTAWLKCEYLQDHIGETFTGTISGVAQFGIFVELQDMFVEGLVHVTSLDSDYFNFDKAQQRLVGERTRKVYSLGGEVKVTVAAVDLEQRKVDLLLVGSGDGKRKAKKVTKGRKTDSKNKGKEKRQDGKSTAKNKGPKPTNKKKVKRASKKKAVK